MIARADIVAHSRDCIGTPFVHQGRLKGIGLDCVGLVIVVARALGISDYDATDYGASPDKRMMRKRLVENLDEIPFRAVLPGDILWFRVIQDPQHLGIVSEMYPEICMVHAYARQKIARCIEQPLGRVWTSRISGCFRYRAELA